MNMLQQAKPNVQVLRKQIDDAVDLLEQVVSILDEYSKPEKPPTMSFHAEIYPCSKAAERAFATAGQRLVHGAQLNKPNLLAEVVHLGRKHKLNIQVEEADGAIAFRHQGRTIMLCSNLK